MLDCLGHHRVVGSDDEQCDVDPRRAGDHGAHESFMARYVDDAEVRFVDGQFGEAQLDGHSAAALFR